MHRVLPAEAVGARQEEGAPLSTEPPVRIALESTDEILATPPPARMWRGQTDDGVPVIAFIALVPVTTGADRLDERMRLALERRVISKAKIVIPVDAR